MATTPLTRTHSRPSMRRSATDFSPLSQWASPDVPADAEPPDVAAWLAEVHAEPSQSIFSPDSDDAAPVYWPWSTGALAAFPFPVQKRVHDLAHGGTPRPSLPRLPESAPRVTLVRSNSTLAASLTPRVHSAPTTPAARSVKRRSGLFFVPASPLSPNVPTSAPPSPHGVKVKVHVAHTGDLLAFRLGPDARLSDVRAALEHRGVYAGTIDAVHDDAALRARLSEAARNAGHVRLAVA